MPRHSKIQKQVQDSVQKAPRKPRKKREVKQPPEPFFIGATVAVSSKDDFKGKKLGIIRNVCKDGGMNVYLVTPRVEGIADYICIHVERGHTIELINESP